MTDQNQMNTVDSMLPLWSITPTAVFAFGLQHVLAMYAWSCCGTDYRGTGDEFTGGGLDSTYYSRLVYLRHCDLNSNIRLRVI